MRKRRGNVSPNNGGCWFCHTEDDGWWKFSFEFDCYFHEACLHEALKDCHEDDEALIIAREFGIEVSV